ncbi:hypothetical protein, partial [Mycoplasmopsis synoviae]|uniref:hypothetical protein n=1 Tax=Mycoplasmopsis synoviae TaxID=2109 RepID=UPI00349F0449
SLRERGDGLPPFLRSTLILQKAFFINWKLLEKNSKSGCVSLFLPWAIVFSFERTTSLKIVLWKLNSNKDITTTSKI